MIDRVHGGVLAYFKEPEGIIDFSSSINPLGLPECAKSIITKNIDRLIHYPEPESKGLRRALASYHNVSHHNILVGNGSIELIYLIPKTLRSKGVLIPIPTFSEYEFAAGANSASLVFVRSRERGDFKIDISRLKISIPKVDLVFLCNPNNPTGGFLPYEEVLSLVDVCRRHKATLVIDEAFIDFVPDHNVTLIREATRNRYLLVLRSLTKFFGLAGLRLGYLVGHRDVIEGISRFQYPWNVNLLAQRVGEEVIKNRDYIKKTCDFMIKERPYLFNRLSGLKGIKVFPSSANFLLCKLKESIHTSELRNRLIKEGILIRDCSNFRGLNGRFFRVSIKRREENTKLILALNNVLKMIEG